MCALDTYRSLKLSCISVYYYLYEKTYEFVRYFLVWLNVDIYKLIIHRKQYVTGPAKGVDRTVSLESYASLQGNPGYTYISTYMHLCILIRYVLIAFLWWLSSRGGC